MQHSVGHDVRLKPGKHKRAIETTSDEFDLLPHYDPSGLFIDKVS